MNFRVHYLLHQIRVEKFSSAMDRTTKGKEESNRTSDAITFLTSTTLLLLCKQLRSGVTVKNK